jgi:hypothetical protein
MTCRFHRLLAALAFGATLVVPVSAQDRSSETQRTRIPGWTFTPGVIFGALYDTNVAIASPDENQNTAADRLFTLAPFGDLSYLSPRTTFSAGYLGTLQRYFDFGALDGTDHRGHLSLRERVSRRVTVFANNNYAQSPTTDRLDINGVPFLRTGARSNSLAGGVESRITKSADAIVRYEMTWVDFVRKDTNLTGGTVHGIHSELSRRFSERVSGGAEYGIRLADLNDSTTHQVFQEAGGVVRYRTGESTTVEGSAGFAYLVDRTANMTKSGPYAKFGLTRRSERVSFGLGYSRNYVPSLSFGGTNQSQETRGYLHTPFRRNRFYVQESAAWRRTNPFVRTELPLDSLFVNTAVGYAVQTWLRVEGYHQFTTQDNNVAGGQISRHVGGLRLVVAEPMRIR